MSNIGNKEIMSKNLKYFIEKSGKDRRELAEIWGFPYSTVTEWINGKKYPRIDRIEIMADYFGILKSDLIEDKGEEHREKLIKNDAINGIISWLQEDEELTRIMDNINKQSIERKEYAKKLLATLTE